jgi:predicted TIM-barrel fold metal-dependent hydrolase
MLIDVHAHLGSDFTFEESFPRELLISKMKNYNVDIQIVQPGVTHDLPNAMSQHNAIAALCREYPGRFLGMANPDPHLDGTAYEDEIARCVEDLKFVGIKLHTYASAVHPDSKTGRRVFECGRKYGIPVMVHTGSGLPFAAPVNLIKVAGDYPDVKIIMAHCGTMLLADEAAIAFSSCPNIYGDTSWSAGYLIKNWIRSYGHRIMLASDLGDNTGTELAKIRTYGFTEEEQKYILKDTAIKVFNLKEKISLTDHVFG